MKFRALLHLEYLHKNLDLCLTKDLPPSKNFAKLNFKFFILEGQQQHPTVQYMDGYKTF